MEKITPNDRNILRELAKKQQGLSETPNMVNLEKEWVLHNGCKTSRPMVTIEWQTFYQDIIPPLLHCVGSAAREIESALYGNFVAHELFGDDSIVKNHFPVGYHTYFKPFDIDVKVEHTNTDGESLGHHFVDVINDLHDDFHLLKKSTFGVDLESTMQRKNSLEQIFGDILPIKLVGSGLYSVPTQAIVHIMSMETMLFSMYDYPDEFHKMMQMLASDYVAYFRFLEEKRLILPTTASEGVGQGTYAYTDELPSYDVLSTRSFCSKDVWGFMDSQETTGISPEMFHEFIYPYYKQVSNEYGMLSYGCCEAVDPIWEKSISTLKNLRKVSISPWCNEEYMGEQLQGTNIVYHRKPSPNFLGVTKDLDETAFTEHVKKTMNAAKNCTIEFTQRDVYTISGNIDKVRKYVSIIRSCS